MVVLYTVFLMVLKQQQKFMVITNNCVGEEDEGQRVHPRRIQVKCKT